MTAEQFHDALTLLPSDLVAQAGKRRSRNPKILRWQRFAAMAACFALVLGIGSFGLLALTPMGGGKSEAMVEQAADEAAAAPESPAAMAPALMAPEAPAEEESGFQRSDAATSAGTGTGALSQPPLLTITSGSQILTLAASGYTWEVPQADGTTLGICADIPTPTDHPERHPVLTAETEAADLLWDTTPQSVTARRWPILEPDSAINADAQDAELIGQALTLCPGAFIYEITAHWPQGTASYAFTVTAPKTIP